MAIIMTALGVLLVFELREAEAKLIEARRQANELAARVSLSRIADAEEELRRAATIDANQNGVGDYGGLNDLLSLLAWTTPDSTGCAMRAGYRFKLVVGPEPEMSWRCYAWPALFGYSGRRVFCMNEKRELMQFESDRATFSGESQPVWESVETGTWTPVK